MNKCFQMKIGPLLLLNVAMTICICANDLGTSGLRWPMPWARGDI